MTTNHATGRQIAKGAAWMMSFKLLDKSVGLISTLVLARVLTPADFGLVAMATALVALLELMGTLSFNSAIIQCQDTERGRCDTGWTFNLMSRRRIVSFLMMLALLKADFSLSGANRLNSFSLKWTLLTPCLRRSLVCLSHLLAVFHGNSAFVTSPLRARILLLQNGYLSVQS